MERHVHVRPYPVQPQVTPRTGDMVVMRHPNGA